MDAGRPLAIALDTVRYAVRTVPPLAWSETL